MPPVVAEMSKEAIRGRLVCGPHRVAAEPDEIEHRRPVGLDVFVTHAGADAGQTELVDQLLLEVLDIGDRLHPPRRTQRPHDRQPTGHTGSTITAEAHELATVVENPERPSRISHRQNHVQEACPPRQHAGNTTAGTPGNARIRAVNLLRAVWWRARSDERGAGYIAAFIVLFGVLTLAGVGVLVDSARIVSAERHASAAAFEAARAGAQAVNVGSSRAGGSTIDAAAAEAAAGRAAASLLAGSDAQLEEITVSSDEIVVTITRQVDPWFPMIEGRTVRETGRARLAVGITQEGQ